MEHKQKPKWGLVALVALIASLFVGGATASARSAPERQPVPANGGDACYEQVQVTEYRYERQKFKTKYQYQKQTRERSRAHKHDAWGPWSDWTWWSPPSYQWSFQNVEVLEEGDHDGQNDNNSTYDRDYRYVKNGTTEQIPDGKETTDWLSGPPAGDGWVQIDTRTRTVNGDRIPCGPQPDDKVDYTEWVDGEPDCVNQTVTRTRTKTVTPYVLVDYKWVPGTPIVTTETDSRSLTPDELKSCTPQPPSKVDYGNWQDGDWECGDTEVVQTRTKTVTPYIWDGDSWELDTANAVTTTETQTRALTAEELESCEPTTKPITGKGYTDHECDATEWHFVITQVDEEANAPASIHVKWANGNEADVPLDKFTGGVAHYQTTANLDSSVVSITTSIYVEWSGQFNVSHGPCEPEEPEPKWETECATITNTGEVVFFVRYEEDGNPVEVKPGTSFTVPIDQLDFDAAMIIDKNGEKVGSFVPEECPEPTFSKSVSGELKCVGDVTGTVSADTDTEVYSFVEYRVELREGDTVVGTVFGAGSTPLSEDFAFNGVGPGDYTLHAFFTFGPEYMEPVYKKATVEVTKEECPEPPVCPEGTDSAGTPIEDLTDVNGDEVVDENDCNTPEPPDQCPDGSNPGDANGDGEVNEDDCDYTPPTEPTVPPTEPTTPPTEPTTPPTQPTGPTTTIGTPPVPPSSSTPTAPSVPDGGLPKTGGNTNDSMSVALILCVGGGAFLLVTRRRRRPVDNS